MRTAIIYVSLIAAGCAGESLDVGDTDVGTTAGSSAGETGGASSGGGTGGTGMNPRVLLPEWPSPNDCVSASSLPVAGVWEGWLQDSQFRNQVPLHIEILGASGLGGVCGTLRWGEGTLPPPPTDPDREWPEGQDFGVGGAAASTFQDGATYTILDGGVRDAQVRFRVTSVEFWKPWCEIQTPQWQPGVKDWWCGNCLDNLTCVCNEEGCAATPVNNRNAAFDLVFEENRATGTAEGNFLSSVGPEVLLYRVD